MEAAGKNCPGASKVQTLNLHQIQKSWTKDWLNSLDTLGIKADHRSQGRNRVSEIASRARQQRRATVDGNSHEPEFFFDSTGRMSNNENNPTADQNHNPPHVENISQTLRRSPDHIAEEQRDQEPSLVNRDVSDTQSTTIRKGTLQEAVSPDVPSRGMPCSQLLQFLQKNIIVAAVSVVGIVAATALLLLALVTYVRKRQSLWVSASVPPHSDPHCCYPETCDPMIRSHAMVSEKEKEPVAIPGTVLTTVLGTRDATKLAFR
ncbi:hypothetical protein MJT46_002828 [Ovis ammon polii x Ovis aries]|nr:hypothetical protein MJT46_002828 [Ovis ammon polii x Ovis aries]